MSCKNRVLFKDTRTQLFLTARLTRTIDVRSPVFKTNKPRRTNTFYMVTVTTTSTRTTTVYRTVGRKSLGTSECRRLRRHLYSPVLSIDPLEFCFLLNAARPSTVLYPSFTNLRSITGILHLPGPWMSVAFIVGVSCCYFFFQEHFISQNFKNRIFDFWKYPYFSETHSQN